MTTQSNAKTTILLATHNGAATLTLMLDRLCNLETPKSEWKLVVVDNNSSDDTLNILKSFSDKLPILILSEKQPGKSRALNLGINYAEGDLYIITDDDILPDKDWISVYRATAERNPEYAFFGGNIHLHWQIEPPAWILAWVPLASTYGIRNHTDSGPCDHQLIVGGNGAFRAEIFEQGHRYREDLGPNSKTRTFPMGNDVEFCRRIADHGFLAYNCGNLSVGHIVKEHTVNEQWILKRCERCAFGFAIRDNLRDTRGILGISRPRVLWIPAFLACALLYFPFKASRGTRLRFRILLKFHYLKGFLKACLLKIS